MSNSENTEFAIDPLQLDDLVDIQDIGGFFDLNDTMLSYPSLPLAWEELQESDAASTWDPTLFTPIQATSTQSMALPSLSLGLDNLGSFDMLNNPLDEPYLDNLATSAAINDLRVMDSTVYGYEPGRSISMAIRRHVGTTTTCLSSTDLNLFTGMPQEEQAKSHEVNPQIAVEALDTTSNVEASTLSSVTKVEKFTIDSSIGPTRPVKKRRIQTVEDIPEGFCMSFKLPRTSNNDKQSIGTVKQRQRALKTCLRCQDQHLKVVYLLQFLNPNTNLLTNKTHLLNIVFWVIPLR
jgi:hypothetical protein